MEAAAAASRTCAICQGQKYLIERQGEHAVAKKCSCAERCPTCEGRGYVISEQESTFSAKVGARRYDVLAPCSCRMLEERILKYNDARVLGRLAHASFEGYRTPEDSHARAREAAEKWAYGYVRGGTGKGFVLSGPVGTGKTHLLTATIRHLTLEKGVAAQYVEISLLYATIRRGFQEGKSGGEIIGPLSEVEVLAIDELGKGRGSPFEMETLDELIARRYNASRTTLFATNYPLAYERKTAHTPSGHVSTEAKAKEAKDELLRERVGERIYSRLCEMCEFVQMPLNMDDWRRPDYERKAGSRGSGKR